MTLPLSKLAIDTAGQPQRIALARALVRRPAILVLDQAASALDSTTDAAINATLDRLAGGRTVIRATHRLSSVVRADQIIVLDGGRLVEQGTHQELLALQGLYYQLWQRQSGLTVSANESRATVAPEWLRSVPILKEVDETLRPVPGLAGASPAARLSL